MKENWEEEENGRFLRRKLKGEKYNETERKLIIHKVRKDE
jgi:hypothetical protein